MKKHLAHLMMIVLVFTATSFETLTEVPPAKGYMIANYTIHDQETFKKYMEAAGSLAPKYNGKVIIYDVKSKTLEGKPESVIAVAEFPSIEETEGFYNSPEYMAARKFRIAATTGWVVLAKGIPQATEIDGTKKGYMIANYTIKNNDGFKKYMEAAGSLAPKYNGAVIVYDENAKVLEGKPEGVIAIAEFSSLAGSERFYNSPEYTSARKFRIASTRGWALLAEGLSLVNEQLNSQASPKQMTKEETDKFINATVDLFTRSNRTPVLRTPDEYGMKYEDILFPAMDGVTLEGWFIPANSDRLIIFNHPMPATDMAIQGILIRGKTLVDLK